MLDIKIIVSLFQIKTVPISPFSGPKRAIWEEKALQLREETESHGACLTIANRCITLEMPFMAIQTAVLLFITYFPDAVLWFPRIMGFIE